MSYDSIVFNVMIASPGDVASERNIVREVIYEWNVVHSYKRKLVLLPVGWETHSSPDMGNRAQDILNKQILGKCDLLVGVFWTRIGTSTGEYLSGTVEEIEKHIEAGKPAMLYFSAQPAHLDSVDQKQYENLKKFKASCQKRGLYETYDNYSEFRDKFYRQLQIKINDHDMFDVEITDGEESDIYESDSSIPELSNEARILLKEASLGDHGTILHVRTIGGTNIQANSKNFISDNNPRVVARWEAALEELLDNELIVERGHEGEVFQVSDLGYKIADMIEL